ncbi:MAG: DUF5683 domain-containing protein [Longimicrobiales bacterium]
MTRAILVTLGFLSSMLGQLQAQQRTPADAVLAADTTPRVSPGKAFYRSLLIPGWGQASVGAHVRGGTFFALQSASTYMMLKTMSRLADARDMEGRRTEAAADSLRTLMRENPADSLRLADPLVFAAAVDSVPGVRRIRSLIESRKDQRQDWVTYVIVFTLASGVDAFVAAHLANFPASIDARPRVGGGTDLQVRLRLGRAHP